MTLLLLLVWWITGSNPNLGHPWSGWFVALLVCGYFDFTELGKG